MRELRAIANLRQYLIRTEFLNLYNSLDLPIGILTLTIDKEPANFDFQQIPKWSRENLRSVRNVFLRMATADKSAALQQWGTNYLIPKRDEWNKKVAHNYHQVTNTERYVRDSVNTFIAHKYYSDFLMSMGKYSDARRILTNLCDSIPNRLNEFKSQVLMCSAYADFLDRHIDPTTIQKINLSAALLKTPVHYTLATVLECHVRMKLMMNPSLPLQRYATIKATSPEAVAFRPIILEQLAALQAKRHGTYHLVNAAKSYMTAGHPQLAARCLATAIDAFQGESWDYIVQQICRSLFRILPRVTMNSRPSITTFFCSKRIFDPKTVQEELFLLDLKDTFYAGFVRALVTDCLAPGFMGYPPRHLITNWPEIGERLFGSFYRGTFFDYKVLDKKECRVGEAVSFTVVLRCTVPDFPLTQVRLITQGQKCEVTTIDVPHPSCNILHLQLTPTTTGRLSVYGIEFEWANVCTLSTSFDHRPIVLNVFPEAPQVTCIVSKSLFDVVIGSICEVDVTITNTGTIDLKNIQFLINGEVPGEVYEPDVIAVCGNCKLPPLAVSETQTVKISFHANLICSKKVDLLFAYWGEELPLRYSHEIVEFNVFPLPDLVCVRDSTSVALTAPSDTHALGYTGSSLDLSKFVALDDRVATLSLVGVEKATEIALPPSVKPFMSDNLTFWYDTGSCLVAVPVTPLESPYSVLFSQHDDVTTITVRNIMPDAPLTTVKVAIVSAEDPPSVVVSGKDFSSIARIEPNSEYNWNVRFVILRKPATIKVLVTCDQHYAIQLVTL